MKIGIDARFYGPIGGGGIGRYTKELIDHLEQIDAKNQYVVFLRRENWEDYVPRNSNFKKVLAPYKWYGWKEQIMMPIKIQREKIDLMHFPHFNMPLLYRGKFVITLHDLILIKFPSKKSTKLPSVYFKLKYLMYKKIIRSAVRKASKIIAPSEYVKQDILKFFNGKKDKIKVIYEGAVKINKNNSFGANKFIEAVDKEADKKIKIGYNKYGRLSFEKDDYVLYVGNAYPHKNLERLISSFSLIIQNNKNLKLVLVGAKNYFYQQIIDYAEKEYPQEIGNIIFWGYAADKELAKLYQKARLYIFPSLEEGFGLPPLEAMSYGIPVVSSNLSCLPEILGDGAMYFDPYNIGDMAEKMIEALSKENLRKELIDKGYKRIKLYDWKKTAEETLGVYLDFRF